MRFSSKFFRFQSISAWLFIFLKVYKKNIVTNLYKSKKPDVSSRGFRISTNLKISELFPWRWQIKILFSIGIVYDHEITQDMQCFILLCFVKTVFIVSLFCRKQICGIYLNMLEFQCFKNSSSMLVCVKWNFFIWNG